jgi:hypothetical protein
MSNINEHLNKRSEELMVFKMPRNETLMDEIFKFDPRNLEATPSAKISEYTIGLSQFLIYFSSQINQTKVKLMQKNRVVDLAVSRSDVKGKTKSEIRQKVIDSDTELQQIDLDMHALEGEIKMTEGLEKYYVELINSLKRELTRREQELKFSISERRL